jgi:protein TonB
MNSTWQLNSRADSLALALAVAIGIHVAAIGLIHFDVFTDRPDEVPTALDVILVQWANETPPEEADFLAQASQQGGGDSPDLKRPAEPMLTGDVAPERPPEPVEQDAHDVEAEQTAAELLATEAEQGLTQPETIDETARNDDTDAQALIEQSLAVARASPDRLAEAQGFPERRRRKFISANTREHMYAAYMRSWVSKVERVGNLNYPEQARRMSLDGALVLSVDVLADGSVEQIRVLQSSGYDILDEAAVRIVRLSSPFSPLPEEITREVDVLTITRTWQFSARSGLY